MTRQLSRRTFVAGLGAAAGAAGTAYFFRKRMPRLDASPPNIILFIADDMRADMTGYSGNAIIRTPTLDALAKESFNFRNHFVTTSICCTSRASIMTGEYAMRHQVYNFETPLSTHYFDQCFFLKLRDAGYYTGFIGKWGIGGSLPASSFDQWYGFDGQGEYFPNKNEAEHLTNIQTRESIRFLNTRPKDKPFLLIISYKAPHAPFIPQQEMRQFYQDITIPFAPQNTEAAAKAAPLLLRLGRGVSEYRWLHMDYQENMRNYYRLISGIDDSMRQILLQLRTGDVLDNSYLFFTSDNGLLLGEHGLGGKYCMYEPSIRTPMLIRPPRSFAGTPREMEMFSLNIDLSPTILDAAGISVPPMSGKTLLPLMRGENPLWRDAFYYEHPEMGGLGIAGCEGIRTREWKYCRYYRSGYINEQLLHMADDPYEVRNAIKDQAHSAALSQLKGRLAMERESLKLT